MATLDRGVRRASFALIQRALAPWGAKVYDTPLRRTGPFRRTLAARKAAGRVSPGRRSGAVAVRAVEDGRFLALVALRVGISVVELWLSVLADGVLTAMPPLLGEFPGQLLDTGLMIPLVLIGLFFYFLILKPERRKQAAHRQMLEAIKKNDRIVTIGGIRGTVVSVNRDADEVVLRVDDNAKLRMTFGAIARIEGDDAKKTEGA